MGEEYISCDPVAAFPEPEGEGAGCSTNDEYLFPLLIIKTPDGKYSLSRSQAERLCRDIQAYLSRSGNIDGL
jgi:hypothetical protein